MKKIIASILIVFIIFALFNIRQLLHIPVIGSIGGAENEKITIDGVVYERDTSGAVAAVDKGRYLGSVTNEKIKVRIYEIPNTDHIYALWEWDGAVYTKIK